MKIFSLLIFGILLIGVASAITCCERTTTGAWCQNANSEAECDAGINPINGEQYRSVSAFCEATSYCRPGTCINNRDGICMPNTAEIVCEQNRGFWSPNPKTSLPQCKLGCCLLGDSAAFVTQVACNRMSSLYGLTVNYRADISNELACLASANPSAEGACVYEKEAVRTCERTTRKECNDKKKSSTLGGVEFHEGFLCSANELETICARSQSTQCEGDDVYFIDTCGNLGNIYDSDKINDENYWTLIQAPDCTPSNNPGNKNSDNCGNCDYYSGSMCRQKSVGENVDYGNYICKDLDCRDYTGFYSGENNYPRHGESWCASDTDGDDYVPGSTHYRLLCYNGEVTTEICDTTRQKICAETIIDDTSDFRTGNCRVNEWHDCTAQDNEADCVDTNIRDCTWIEEMAGREDYFQPRDCVLGFCAQVKYSNYYFTEEGLKNDGEGDGACVPKYAPGFERDGRDDVTGSEMCGVATSVCYVKMERKLGGEWECNPGLGDDLNDINNCSCLDSNDWTKANPEWVAGLNGICTHLGDCGSKENYKEAEGSQSTGVVEIINLE